MKRALAIAVFFAAVAAAAAPPRVGRLALVLEDQPVAARIDIGAARSGAAARAVLSSAAARAAAREIQDRQAPVRAELGRRGFRVTYAAHTLVNAVFVAGTPEDLKRVSGIPGVVRAVYLPPIERTLNTALPLVKASEAWVQAGGMTNGGAGVNIGIIDTGIDHTHPGFQQACASPPEQPFCDRDNGDCAFTNSKVVAARSYVALISYSDPQWSSPDDLSPRDRVGHGTALAMIAAGNQVTTDVATISGVAPGACLGNYKIFGSPGVNDYTYADVLAAALEQAFQDGMDIVSISIGAVALRSPLERCATGDGEVYCDSFVDAVIESGIQNGMTVVVAAGNSGDLSADSPTLNSIESPGIAPGAITVGASNNAHVFHELVRVGTDGDDTPPNLREIPARFGNGPRPTPKTDAFPLKDILSAGSDPEGCSALPAGSLDGTIVILERGARTCAFSEKVKNAHAAGAKGVIIQSDEDELFVPSGLAATGIPAVLISRSHGIALRQFLGAHQGRTAVLDTTPKPSDSPNVNRVAPFSSRGPAIGTFGIKPEVLAPGRYIYTATQNFDPNSDMYDYTRYGVFDGTSFSTPIIAGIAALVKQAHPGYTPAQIKSAVVNTATRINVDSEQLGLLDQGAGLVNAEAAVRSNITVDPATISFGRITSTNLPTPRATLNINGDNWNASVDQTIPAAGVTIRTERRGSQLDVWLEGSLPQAGVYHGAIVITGGAVDLRVPYAFFVSDNVPATIVPLIGAGFWGGTGETLNGCTDADTATGTPSLAFKLLDRFGIPITTADNGAVIWNVLPGGPRATITLADADTDVNGIAAACLTLGATEGYDTVRATVNYLGRQLTYDFQGFTRYWPDINYDGLVDAASNTINLNVGLAPGSLMFIYGEGLSETTSEMRHAPGYPLNLPLSIAGVYVTFDTEDGISVPGRLLFVSDRQVNVQIPWELAGYNGAWVKVVNNSFPTLVRWLPLTVAAPQIFQYFEPDKMDYAVAQSADDWSYITPGAPARRGQWIVLYGNGFGPLRENQPATGETTNGQLAETLFPVTVTVGGRPAEIYYAGLQPEYVGLYQLNIRIPDDAPLGPEQPIVVTINGISSKPVKIAIAE